MHRSESKFRILHAGYFFGCRKTLTSNSYSSVNIDLRKAFTKVLKTICIKKNEMIAETNELLIKAFLACRLILLDKSLALKPAGKGEAVQKISGNLVMKMVKKDVTKADDLYS